MGKNLYGFRENDYESQFVGTVIKKNARACIFFLPYFMKTDM